MPLKEELRVRNHCSTNMVKRTKMYACADPEIFMRGGPTKMVIFGHRQGGGGGGVHPPKKSRNYLFLGKIFRFQGGGGVRTPGLPLWIRAWYVNACERFYHIHTSTELLFCATVCKLQTPHINIFEPSRGKTNNVVSEQVRHKPGCTSTEAG